jgi:hypothetical protein
MQTDPNWANFLYDPSAKKLGLIDFGASREYTKEFMDGWYRLLMSAVKGDRETMKDESEKLGYLTGEENEVSFLSHLWWKLTIRWWSKHTLIQWPLSLVRLHYISEIWADNQAHSATKVHTLSLNRPSLPLSEHWFPSCLLIDSPLRHRRHIVWIGSWVELSWCVPNSRLMWIVISYGKRLSGTTSRDEWSDEEPNPKARL